MTMQRPANPADPPQAAQAPTEPTDDVLDNVAEAVEAGREQISEARQAALDAARSDAERAAVNARFDAMQESFGEFTNRIEAAIQSGNERLIESISGALAAVTSTQGQGESGDDPDGEILSVEEITEGIADAATDGAAAVGEAAGAAAETVVQAADEAPKRAHALFRPLWGGNK